MRGAGCDPTDHRYQVLIRADKVAKKAVGTGKRVEKYVQAVAKEVKGDSVSEQQHRDYRSQVGSLAWYANNRYDIWICEIDYRRYMRLFDN